MLKYDPKRKLWVGIDAFTVPTSNIKTAVGRQLMLDDANSGRKTALAIEMAITHAGFVNLNDRLYLEDAMRESTPTWLTPFPKPVIRTHDIINAEPIGRVYAAEYRDEPGIGVSVNAKGVTFEDAQKFFREYRPGSKPKGHILAGFYITDKDAMDKWLDGRYQTVSVGFTTRETFCSICGENLANLSPEQIMEHEHVPGKDGCFTAVGHVTYDHLAVVNVPADEYVYVASMKLTEELFGDAAKPRAFYINQKQTISLGDEAATPMTNITLSSPREEKILWPAEAKSLVEDAKREHYVTNTNLEHKHRAVLDPETGNGTTDWVLGHSHEIVNKVLAESREVYDYDATPDEAGEYPVKLASHAHVLGERVEALTDTAEVKYAFDYVCTDCIPWGPLAEDDKIAVMEAERDYDSVINELIAAGAVPADAKLTAATRKKLPDSVFCGPGRSFPVHDCAHYRAALAYLDRSHFSESTKKKIHACIMRRGKKLGCVSKENKDEATLTLDQILARDDVIAHISKLEAAHKGTISSLEAKIAELAARINELEAAAKKDETKAELDQARETITALTDQNIGLFHRLKDTLIDNVILKSLLARSGSVYESLVPGINEKLSERIASVRNRLADESSASLEAKLDEIGDLENVNELPKLTAEDFSRNYKTVSKTEEPAPSLGDIFSM